MTYEIPPPPSGPRGEPTGPHSLQTAQASAFPWRTVAASVITAIIIAGGTGLVTWGNATAEARYTRAQMERLTTQLEADRLRSAASIRALELKQVHTEAQLDNAVRRLDETTTRLESAVERIEDRLPSRRR